MSKLIVIVYVLTGRGIAHGTLRRLEEPYRYRYYYKEIDDGERDHVNSVGLSLSAFEENASGSRGWCIE
jgi:hypothetical protein